MSNIVPFNQSSVPAHIQARKAQNDPFLAGLSAGVSFPTIGLKGTRFVVKKDGGETVLPTTEITVVLLGARPNITKSYYASKFDPNNTEMKSPDCFSDDGVSPDPSAPLKQHTSCAGCPQNQFGSGKDAAGNPSKGKACSDYKMLAVFASGSIYGFRVPAASLKAFRQYIAEAGNYNVDVTCAKTIIGFDPNFTYPVLTFGFGGFLDEAQCAAIDEKKGTQEVKDIVGSGKPSEPVQPPANSAPQEAPKAPEPQKTEVVQEPVVPDDPFAAVNNAKPEKTKAAKGAPAKKVVEQPLNVASGDLSALAADLGLDL